MVKVKVKRLFFNTPEILAVMDKATHSTMNRVGARLRLREKGLLRYRKPETASAPGQPPFVHRGTKKFSYKSRKTGEIITRFASPLKELIYYDYDRAAKTLVVGPEKRTLPGTVPGLHEFGGTITRRKKIPGPARRKARSR